MTTDIRFKTMTKRTEFSDQVDFRTPKYLFNFIKSLYGKVEFDGACFEDGSNALATPLRLEEYWPDGIVYSNPPFDTNSIISWIDKGHEYVKRNENNVHIMCVPNKICYVQLQQNSWSKINKIIALGGRVDFTSEFSTKGGASRSGSLILIQDSRIEGGTKIEFKLLSKLKEDFK